MTGQRVGKVYFLELNDPRETGSDLGLVKVGITWGDVAERIASLQTGNPYDLRCSAWFETPWPHEVEQFIHRAHANEMHRNEWLKCAQRDLPTLVNEARVAAKRIAERKAMEQGFLARASNGQTRRASVAEFRLHVDVRKLMKELVPAELRLSAADNRLKAATGMTLGVPGIIRSNYLPATIRFSSSVAHLKFAAVTSECFFQEMTSCFRWRKMPQKRTFVEENAEARAAQRAAKQSAAEALRMALVLTGWAERTLAIERWHDEFLQGTALVQRRRADIADCRTELIASLGEFEAIDGICSFRRTLEPVFDASEFCRKFPIEAAQCAVHVGPRLRKRVYSSRSYLAVMSDPSISRITE